MATSSASCQVRVGVRIRPLTSQEIKQGGKQVLDVSPPCIGIGERRFTYDAVFDSSVAQQELYESVSGPLLNSFMDGYNATIMAYGQTGSGKTFTMGSEAHSETESVSHSGLIPRFLSEIFEQLQQQKWASSAEGSENKNNGPVLLKYSVSASFLEVYGEDVHDLLDRGRPSLPLREDASGGIVIAGLTKRSVSNATQALEVLNEGTMNRTTAATLMNLTSSRSHAVFTITLSQTTKSPENGDIEVTTESRFTFVDLAGSERMKKTGAEGERAREGIKINEGLLALGNVINALADEERLAKEKKVHVPYRQSKLTRLLQDALGGNSQTLFLACVSPSDTNASETLSTLHYANRARNIKNAPTKNVDSNILELQRLSSLNRVLECELIKLRFQNKEPNQEGAESKIGEIDESLLVRSDVQAYIQQLHDVASENQETCKRTLAPITASKLPILPRAPSATQLEFTSPIRPRSARKCMAFEATPNRSILEKFDDPLLDEVDPDAEMAILDQLLEMEQRDQQYGREQKTDSDQLKLVEGELAAQEVMLLQLKESLRVYHNMKERYEVLMGEVQQLEVEKEQLAEQLEKAKADPSTGCSASIKKKLEKVEQSLTRARTETRKHREMYRKAEQEAQKCKALERKIAELKQGRVALMKKQKEAAARHKEYNEAKAREIAALKRKQRTKEKEVSKLQDEIRSHKNNLEKRKVFCDKLAKKLKQTETHLMKLVSMRNRDFRDRASTIGIGGGRRRSTMLVPQKLDTMEDEPKFAPINEEVKSMKFMLDKLVNDKVGRSEVQRQYEESVAEYSEAMRKLVSEVKALEEARRNDMDVDERERHQNVEELEFRVEVLGKELEELRAKLPQADDDDDDGHEVAEAMVASKDAPVLRTLLLETVEMYATSELQRRRLVNSVERKDCALESLENEVEKLNGMVATLSQDLARRRRLSSEDQVEMIQSLEESKARLEEELRDTQARMIEATTGMQKLQTDNEKLQDDYASAKTKLTLAEVILQQKEGVHPSEEFLDEAQALWRELGIDLTHREAVRQQIETCLEDTCRRKLEEASVLKESTSADICKVETELEAMRHALGVEQPQLSVDPSKMTLLKRLEWLKTEHSKMQPTFASAMERRDKIASDVLKISQSMQMEPTDLSMDLQRLLSQKNESSARDVEKIVAEHTPSVDLSDFFLTKCEEDLSMLRLKKARILVHNTELKNATTKLAQEMNLCEEDVVNVSLHSIRNRHLHLPGWWDQTQLVSVARSVVLSSGVIPPTTSYSNHVEMIHEALLSVSKGRSQLSTVLREIVTRAQKTLLDIVEGEVDASEAYASFHDALFRLPPLSQEFVEACITEMDALVSGVETMAQSEIEALTVVWEALNVSMKDRGQFWSKIDDFTKTMEAATASPFDEVLRTCAEDKEQWVLTAVKNCRSSYKRLEARLFKLERIHTEVERLRSKQDSKSRIISLDSELRILSARLSDFEDKKCNKERLLTKKSGSAALLKEERYRKQMQGKYSATLEQLAASLQEWKDREGSAFDNNLLSNEVRALLQNSDGSGNWVEKRTEFMHLRMVQSAVKRKPEKLTRLTPPKKRPPKPTKESVISRKRDPAIPAPSPFFPKAKPTSALDSASAIKKRKTDENKVKSAQTSKLSKLQKVTSGPPAADSSATKQRPLPRKRESTTLLPFGNVLSDISENES